MLLVALHPSAAAIEEEIDRAHKTHALVSLPYSSAIFHLLCYADLEGAVDSSRLTVIERSITLGQTVSALKYAARWLATNSTEDTRLGTFSSTTFEHGASLLREAKSYLMINAAYSWAHRGFIDLKAAGKRLKISFNLSNDDRYEAYDMLVKPNTSPGKNTTPLSSAKLEAELDRCVGRGMVMGAIPTARSVLAASYDVYDAAAKGWYKFPGSWAIGDFTLDDYKSVNTAIRSILLAWLLLTDIAHSYDSSYARNIPFVVSRGELLAAVKDVTGLAKSKVRRILDLLTYSRATAATADPALQPLVAIANNEIVLSGQLILGGSPERNLIALINTQPSMRADYDRLKNKKEALMRSRLEDHRPSYCRSWHGKLQSRTDLPDVDYALFDESTSTLLIAELKWFVAPDETRELADRSEDIRKGVAQCKTLMAAIAKDSTMLKRFGAVKDFICLVISANSIGMSYVQDDDVPVITESHFVAEVASASNLREVLGWLRARQYLPEQGRDYASERPLVPFFSWELEWYGFRPLSAEPFFPLSGSADR